MNDLFGGIYELFRPIYGDQLASYLYGFCGTDEGLYSRVGLAMVLISILTCLIFYFIYVNSKRYKLKHWLLFMSIAGILAAIFAFYLPYADLDSGFVCSEYLYNPQDAVFFGIINFILACILFFIVSVGLRFIGKPQARHTPF